MLENKRLPAIVIGAFVALIVLTYLGAYAAQTWGSSSSQGTSKEYETKLFDTSEIITLNIIMDEDQWQDMIDNASSEEYYACDVEVNGTTFYNVGIRPKGNTSLSSVVSSDSDRYSFKLDFDQYVDGQTCFGLDKLVLNNNYADATNMKEAIAYDMFAFLDADASLYNYAKISVNGTYTGVYLALEAVEDSFVERNYGELGGDLYKPENMGMGGDKDSDSGDKGGGDQQGGGPGDDNGGGQQGGGPGGDMPSGMPGQESSDTDTQQGDTSSGTSGGTDAQQGQAPSGGNQQGDASSNTSDGTDAQQGQAPSGGDQQGDTSSSDQTESSSTSGTPGGGGNGGGPGGGGGDDSGGGPGGSDGGSNLEYTDDDLDSYSTIWDGAKTDSTDVDHEHVVEALKNISEGNDLEKYLDVDNVLKYMAAHTFVVNLDSLTGNMAHNYYLYVDGYQLNIIPWDYNLSFGGFSAGGGGGGQGGSGTDSASEMINWPIDSPFEGTTFFDSLLENDEYRAQYHEYLQQLVTEYVNGGRFSQTYDRIRSQIDDLVADDPTAFYSYDEYDAGAKMLVETVKLRAASIAGQLDGTIPSTSDGQKEDSSALIDASSIDTSVMGGQNMGGQSFEFNGMRVEFDEEGNMTVSEQSASEDSSSDEGTESSSATSESSQSAASGDQATSGNGGRPGGQGGGPGGDQGGGQGGGPGGDQGGGQGGGPSSDGGGQGGGPGGQQSNALVTEVLPVVGSIALLGIVGGVAIFYSRRKTPK